MRKFEGQKRYCVFLWGVLIVLAVIAGFVFLGYQKPRAQREDYRRISSEEYDTVFLAMYPLDTYREEDFAYYRAMTLFKASYCIPRFSVMEAYMEKIAKSGNQINTVYLGIRPDRVKPEALQELINRYPGVAFEIIFACPSAEYWIQLSQDEYEQTLGVYCEFLSAVPEMENASFYFMSSEEWLINNPSNYIDQWMVNEAVASIIMTHCDSLHGYQVTDGGRASEALTEVTGRLRLEQETYPDLSDTCILFFGDSIIGNYTDSTSIPGIVEGLTGATVFNCGYGGNSAAEGADDIALPGILEAFFQKDLSGLPREQQVYAGIASYLADPPENKRFCFVINYGLNDYFEGYPVYTEDPYDRTSYCGALRRAVNLIRTNIPDARIVLCTPNFVAAFEGGTEPHGSMGNVLSDYADAVLALSQELETDVLDNFHELGITLENNGDYLTDKVHPDFNCRYLMGQRLCRLLR